MEFRPTLEALPGEALPTYLKCLLAISKERSQITYGLFNDTQIVCTDSDCVEDLTKKYWADRG